MTDESIKNAPPLYGWAIATGVGAVAFGVSLAAIGLGWMGSLFVGALLLLLVGTVFSVADLGGPKTGPNEVEAPTVARRSGAADSSAAAPGAGGAVSAQPAPGTNPATAAAAAAAAAGATASVASGGDAPGDAPEVAATAQPQMGVTAPAQGKEPLRLDAPRNGQGDDLQKITGIGPVLEKKLNEMGIWHYSQIAQWSEAEIVWIDDALSFKGRVERDDWIGQARSLGGQS